jgi:hypothetical protein
MGFIQRGAAMATSRPSPLIRFAALSFDPLTERPVVPEFGQCALPSDSGPVRTIVQFQHPLSRADQTRLKQAYGVALRDYVPDYAFTAVRSPVTPVRCNIGLGADRVTSG